MSTIDWPQSSLTNFSPLVAREFDQESNAPIVIAADVSHSTRCGVRGEPIARVIARAVAALHPQAVVIGSDQVADLAGEPLGKADAALIRAQTGFAIGGVPPVAHETKLPIVIDASLARFETVYAAAGHPYCVFATSVAELARITGAEIKEGIGKAG